VLLEPGKARLIDFGLVTKANETGLLGGTPGFFTPEQLDEIVEEKDFAPAADIFKLGVTLAIAAGVNLSDLWGIHPRSEEADLRRAMEKGPRLTRVKPAVREVIAPMLAFDASQRPTAAKALELARHLLPTGSAKASGHARSIQIPQPAQKSVRSVASGQERPALAAFQADRPIIGHTNVGAEVVVVDRLGLDWSGTVVGADPKRVGNILVRHESTRGSDNVRSYPLSQVIRGTLLK
jgi:serine/threonine protein kinase